MKPESVNIMGINYKIHYVKNASEVDIHKREALWGQIDYWTRTIRVFDDGRPIEDVWQTIFHEVLHGISHALKIKAIDADKGDTEHDTVSILATALTDVLFRNGWIKNE